MSSHCVGDIGNNNGQLQCSGGQPAAPAAAARPSGAGYPGPGYGPPPGTGAGICAASAALQRRRRLLGALPELRHEEHDIRDRLAYTPYGEEREQAAIPARQGPGRAGAVPAILEIGSDQGGHTPSNRHCEAGGLHSQRQWAYTLCGSVHLSGVEPYGRVMISIRWPSGSSKYRPRPP